MPTRGELISQWRAGLLQAQAAQFGVQPARARAAGQARVYRFLLASYGEGVWRPDGVEAADDRPPGGATFVDWHRGRGKPPKSPAAIRRMLDRILGAGKPKSPVPPKDGLTDDDWTAAASFPRRVRELTHGVIVALLVMLALAPAVATAAFGLARANWSMLIAAALAALIVQVILWLRLSSDSRS